MQGWFAEARRRGAQSPLAALDARTKLALAAAAALAVLAASSLAAQAVLFAATLGYALLLRRPLLLALLYAALAAMMALAVLCGLAVSAFAPELSGLSAKALVIPFLRGASAMNAVLALALTTKVESLLGALERLRLPFILFLPAAVMVRFIPTFLGDFRQAWEALRIRGWPMGPAMMAAHPVLSARLLFAPILFRALLSAESLGVAAELKGLRPGRRTLERAGGAFGRGDAVALALAAAAAALAALAEIHLGAWLMTGAGAGMP